MSIENMEEYLDQIMEGMCISTSPATNAGAPFTNKKGAHIRNDNLQDEITSDDEDEDNAYKSIESEVINLSKEQEKELDQCLEYFKSEDLGDLTDIISNLL